MSIWEKMFGGPKDIQAEMKESPSVSIKEEEKKRTPKTLEEVRTAVGELQQLKSDRYDTLEKHRDMVQKLRDLGVNEYNPDTAPRTETVNDILNPIEEELQAISKEITEKREEFDLQPSRDEVLGSRIGRIGHLRTHLTEQFKKTPSGHRIAEFDTKIAVYQNNNIGLYESEINKLKEEKNRFFHEDKIAYQYLVTRERMDYLEEQLEKMRRHAKEVGYDENGINEVRK